MASSIEERSGFGTLLYKSREDELLQTNIVENSSQNYDSII